MTDRKEAIQGIAFKDRKTGLVIFGIIQIIFGGACALAVPFVILSMVMLAVHNGGFAMPMMIPAILFYIIPAAWFIWMGIGSIKARRWARALLLVSSWIWLIGGISAIISVLVIMPNMHEHMAQDAQIPQEVATIIKYAMAGFMTVFYVIIPGAFVLFYGSKNVKATCEFRDSRIRWTDKCPLPVLAVSFLFAFWAASALFMGFYGWVIPFFGVLLSGVAGAVVVFIITLLLGYVAWGTYKLSIKAWWCSILLTIAWVLSTGITFSRVSIWEFYEKMDFPAQQLDIMRQYVTLQNFTMVLFSGLWIVGFLGYLLYTKKYFRRPSEQESASQKIRI